MKNYKEFAIFLIPYFTCSSALYHIAYWGTFNINGLAYIGISELIKSFVSPFFSFAIAAFIGIVYGLLLAPNGSNTDKVLKAVKFKKSISKWVFLLLLTIWLGIIIFISLRAQTIAWLYFATIFGLLPILLLLYFGFLRSTLPDYNNRVIAIIFFVYIPVLSFAIGKYQSGLIYYNQKYQFAINEKLDTNGKLITKDTFKLIGNVDQRYFFTDLKNSATYIVRADKIDTLVLRQFKNY